jgi:hypothetical protein
MSKARSLKDWKESRPDGHSSAGVAKPLDKESEQAALKYLQAQNIGVSYDSLIRAIGEGDLVTVDALLVAGVSVGADSAQRADYAVVSGLSAARDPVHPVAKERIIKTLDILVKYGLNLGYADQYGNKIMMSAAQFCSVPVVVHLADLGAEINPVNKQNTTPLDFAFIRGNWASAEALIDRGARMTKQHADTLFFELPEDPAQRALVLRSIQ